jgi:hypothetical protein
MRRGFAFFLGGGVVDIKWMAGGVTRAYYKAPRENYFSPCPRVRCDVAVKIPYAHGCVEPCLVLRFATMGLCCAPPHAKARLV